MGDESAVAALRRFAKPAPVEERCEFCDAIIAPAHRHLLELANRRIICACDACALLFQNVSEGHYKLVPRDARQLLDFKMSEALWDDFALPINLTFFYRDTVAGKVVAMYPSPAGATESLLPQSNWAELERNNPALTRMAYDVEALLVNRVGAAREYFIAPIDVCYELVGLIRKNWRGFTGGETVWREIDSFFEKLRANSVQPAPQQVEVPRARP